MYFASSGPKEGYREESEVKTFMLIVAPPEFPDVPALPFVAFPLEFPVKTIKPPIIIIQGDHGTASQDQMEIDLSKVTNNQFHERMDILNAYYLPGKESNKLLYHDITTVNSFRIIFNNYFNAGYKILDDVSYFSQHESIFQLITEPNPEQK